MAAVIVTSEVATRVVTTTVVVVEAAAVVAGEIDAGLDSTGRVVGDTDPEHAASTISSTSAGLGIVIGTF